MRKALFILGDLSDRDIDWLAEVARKEEFDAGAVLTREGTHATDMYILLDGRLSVRVEGSDGKEINVLFPGEFIGELSFLDSRPPSATVVASSRSIVAAISREMLRSKLDQDTAFAAHFYRALGVFLAHRLRRQTVIVPSGGQTESLSDELETEDELDPELLDSASLAAKRFDWIKSRFMSG